MANEILQKIDEFGEAVAQMRKATDESIVEIKKGNETRAKELEIQAERWNKKIDELMKITGSLNKENEAQKMRIEILEALSDRPKGTPAEQLEQKHAQTWVKYLRSGFKDSAIESELKGYEKQLIQMKANEVLSGTALQGGNAVPKIVSEAIDKLVLKLSDILPEVNNVTAGSPDYNELVTIAGANGGWSSETGTRSQSRAANLRKVTITHGELYAYPRASNWSLQDLFFDVLGWLTQDAADTFAVSISTAIFNGSGSSQPTGMTNSAPTNVDDYASPMRAAAVYEYVATGASPITTAPAFENLMDLQVTVRRPYQPNAKWAMNSVTIGQLRRKKDTTGNFLWQPSLQANQPDLLLGKPVIVWEDMPNYAGSAIPIAYGDFRRAYTFAWIGAMTMIRDEVTVPGFTNFLMARRAGGIPRNNDAVKFLKQIAS